MTLSRRSIFAAALGTVLALPAAAHEVADPTIKRSPRDGVVRLYGAGGPDTAFKKVAAVFTAQTGVKVEVTGGPEPTWSRKAQADADVIWGTAEEDITALLETYTNFAWADVTPIYIRPAIIAVRKGNPKHIGGFEDLLKPGTRLAAVLNANESHFVCSAAETESNLPVPRCLGWVDRAEPLPGYVRLPTTPSQ